MSVEENNQLKAWDGRYDTHPDPPAGFPKTPDRRPVLVRISMPSIQRPART